MQRHPQALELDDALLAPGVHEEVDAVVPDDAVARKHWDRDFLLHLEPAAAERRRQGAAQDFLRDVPDNVADFGADDVLDAVTQFARGHASVAGVASEVLGDVGIVWFLFLPLRGYFCCSVAKDQNRRQQYGCLLVHQ